MRVEIYIGGIKMKSSRKFISLLLSALIATSFITACGKSSDKTASPTSTASTSGSTFAGYPMKTNTTLKIWSSVLGLQKEYSDSSQSPFHSGLEKNTGAKLKWTFVSNGVDSNQAFNLMIASGDLPDIIIDNWGGKSGGPDGYIKNNYIIKLNDILPQYAPNLWDYLQKNPTIDKDVKTDSGTYYAFPWLRGDQFLTVFRGLGARKDWMDELGLKVPETISELESMLRVMKEKKGAQFEMVYDWSNEQLIGAYGLNRGYFQSNGKVKYGPGEKAYKDYLTLLNRWYKDGLIDKDFASIDANTQQTKLLNDKIGVYVTSGGNITSHTQKLQAQNPKASIVGLPYPVLNKGDKVAYSQMDPIYNGIGATITTACKDVEAAARFLDYGYSKDGLMYWNFGTEGESYSMVNGNPQYTEKVTKYADGISSAMDKYIGSQWSGPTIQDKRMYQAKTSDVAVAAIDLWTKNTDVAKNMIPVVSATAEESQETAKIQNAIDTYVKEMFYKFVLGAESLDKFDDYLAQLKKLNIDRAIELKQAQLDRYNKR